MGVKVGEASVVEVDAWLQIRTKTVRKEGMEKMA